MSEENYSSGKYKSVFNIGEKVKIKQEILESDKKKPEDEYKLSGGLENSFGIVRELDTEEDGFLSVSWFDNYTKKLIRTFLIEKNKIEKG